MFTLTHRLLHGHPVPADDPVLPEPGFLRSRITRQERSLLDLVMPEYHFRGKVKVSVDASPEEALRALEEVILADLPLVHAISSLRDLPGRVLRRRSLADDHLKRPVFEVADPLRLGEDPGREVVIGLVGTFHRLFDPHMVDLPDLFTFTRFNDEDYQKLAINFRAVPERDRMRTTLTSEHRTMAPGAASRRRFALSWYLLTGWGGNLMLRQVLNAVKRRAESGHRPALLHT